MSYIEREAVHDLVRELPKYIMTSHISSKNYEMLDAEKLQELIDSIPAADVVEVVRCKDCKHGQKNNYGQLRGRYICEYHQDYTPLFSPSHFCGNGERREE